MSVYFHFTGAPRIVDWRRNIQLRRNVGLFTVLAVLARDSAVRARFREPLSGELFAEHRDIFRRFAIASKYAYKITAFPVRFGCPQNGHDHFIQMKRLYNI